LLLPLLLLPLLPLLLLLLLLLSPLVQPCRGTPGLQRGQQRCTQQQQCCGRQQRALQPALSHDQPH
jgi:hypothetical protein